MSGLMDKEQPKEALEEMGYESLSSFVNNIDLLISLFFIFIVHWIILWFPRSHNISEEPSKIKIITKIFKTLYHYFTFGVYIRFFLEAFQFIVLGSFSEIYCFDLSSSSRIISICLSCLFLGFSIFIFCLSSTYLFKEPDEILEDDRSDKLEEFNSGLK